MEGRSPSTERPIRRCVAPAATACSKSPLMPAETSSLRGGRRRAPGEPGQVLEVGAGSSPSGATVMRPPSTSARRGDDGGQVRDPAGTTPARPGSVASKSTWTRQVSVRPAASAPRERADQLDAVDAVHEVGVARDGAGLVGLQPAQEVPPQRRRDLVGLVTGLGVAVLAHVATPSPASSSTSDAG